MMADLAVPGLTVAVSVYGHWGREHDIRSAMFV